MGVNISDLFPTSKVTFQDLTGRKIAIDAMNVLYQFLAIIRQPDGTPLKDSKGNVTSHMSGLFYRTARMLENNIKPVYVFDGKPPSFKHATVREREERRAEARARHEAALERGDIVEAKKWAMQGMKVDDKIVSSSKELLEALGVPYVDAPSEGEAQASYMALRGTVWAASSQDFDSLLFGAPILLRNVAISGKRRLPGKQAFVDVEPEKIVLAEGLKRLGITREQLILIGLLVGTDYNPGFKGIGPKKALDLVKKHPNVSAAIAHLEKEKDLVWEGAAEPQQLFEFFMSPPVLDTDPKWVVPDPEAVIKILVDKHEFSPERINNTLEKIKPGAQSRLDSWLKK